MSPLRPVSNTQTHIPRSRHCMHPFPSLSCHATACATFACPAAVGIQLGPVQDLSGLSRMAEKHWVALGANARRTDGTHHTASSSRYLLVLLDHSTAAAVHDSQPVITTATLDVILLTDLSAATKLRPVSSPSAQPLSQLITEAFGRYIPPSPAARTQLQTEGTTVTVEEAEALHVAVVPHTV